MSHSLNRRGADTEGQGRAGQGDRPGGGAAARQGPFFSPPPPGLQVCTSQKCREGKWGKAGGHIFRRKGSPPDGQPFPLPPKGPPPKRVRMMSWGQRGHHLARRRRGARWVSAGGGGPARRAPAAGRRDRPAAADLGSVLLATPLQKSKWGEWGSTIKGGQTQKGSPMGFRRGRGGAGPPGPGGRGSGSAGGGRPGIRSPCHPPAKI